MQKSAKALKLDQIFPGSLPGPVIGEEKITPSLIARLSPVLREACAMAQEAGVPVKKVTCRLPGVPARKDGSHEVQMIVPQSREIFVAGTTL